MSWKAVMEEAAAVPAEGEHDATLIGIRRDEGPHGPIVRLDFVIGEGLEFEDRQVSGIASDRLSENTKLGRWVAAILGRVPNIGEEVGMGDLLNRPCRTVVKHKANQEGQTFANVVDLRPRNG